MGQEVSEPYGWLPVPESAFTEKRVGTNYFRVQASSGHAAYTMTSDFDPLNFDAYDTLVDGGATDLENVLMPGDSGGPSFVFENGAWRLIGIHYANHPSPFFPGANFGYGATSADWNLVWFLDQIYFYLNG
ncbi:MAG TPA: hypothetical protein PKA27_06145 [Fimbriimonadaceae bacterium]|nr:hypothetical protein [Fimbriimonadaceae bacterium]